MPRHACSPAQMRDDTRTTHVRQRVAYKASLTWQQCSKLALLKVSGFLTEWLVVQALLTPAVAPGQCLPLDGTTGYVDIRLHHPVYLTGFSLEHIPAAIAYNVSSAPNKVSLLALSPPQTHKVKGGLFTPVRTHGPYRYDVEANSAVQTFSIFSETPEPVSFVRLQVRCYLL